MHLQGQDEHLSHSMVDIDGDPRHVRVFAEFLIIDIQKVTIRY